ncbi:MAG TPA: tRNA (adenosine(37)-N6)-dimethylallyltransferase MiaA [Dehalococcoidia bacterium]|nr:tRNA (adenosine(37)-N6)-dimethylallyltransferase MiaA [Dehalococcoidia bacterium]
MSRRPLVAVVGATATGKSDVAIALAEALGGEVVNADAYQVYRGLDVGTAKVGAEQRARVPHHLIDITEPEEPLTLARFLDAAQAALDDIWARGVLPVLAGGSGQYVWALLEGWQVPRVAPNLVLRAELEALASNEGAGALLRRLGELDPEAASRLDPDNTRRIIRAIEVVIGTGRTLAACQTRQPIDADVLVLGLRLSRDELYARLDARTDAMFDAGFVDEVRRLRAEGRGETQPVRGGVGYKEVSAYLDGEYDFDEAVRRMKNANHRLVRRQDAWFKQTDARIHWLDAGPDAAAGAIEQAKSWLVGLRAAPVS